MAEIAILGHGVVGSGVMEVLLSHSESLKNRAKEESGSNGYWISGSFPILPYSGIFTKEFDAILNDPDIKIVVEVMGGLHPAFAFVKACLENGKAL